MATTSKVHLMCTGAEASVFTFQCVPQIGDPVSRLPCSQKEKRKRAEVTIWWLDLYNDVEIIAARVVKVH